VKKTLQILIPLLLSGILLWWTLKDMPWGEVQQALSKANWGLVILSLVPTFFAHLARAQRWRLLLQPVATVPTLAESFAAVMSAYLANLALPRAGELVRCTLLTRRRGINVEVSVGTVIAERAFDLVMLAIITGLSFLLEFDELLAFFTKIITGKNETDVHESTNSNLIIYLLVFGLLVFILAFALRDRISKLPFYDKVFNFVKGLMAGIFSALKLKNRGQFLVLTVVIWVCYYLSGWICLEALPELSGIGPVAAMMIFTVGSFGMVAPVQGGYGPFEFMVISGLTLIYGYSEGTAAASAILMHNSQTAFSILLGAPLMAWLAMGKKHEA
jgi:uncharacterized protein (TIRG00374 family)